MSAYLARLKFSDGIKEKAELHLTDEKVGEVRCLLAYREPNRVERVTPPGAPGQARYVALLPDETGNLVNYTVRGGFKLYSHGSLVGVLEDPDAPEKLDALLEGVAPAEVTSEHLLKQLQEGGPTR